MGLGLGTLTQPPKDLSCSGDVVEVMETSIDDREQVLGGRVGEVEVVEGGVVIGWQRSGQHGVGCVVFEKFVHILRDRRVVPGL
jgi:hypothetical protein